VKIRRIGIALAAYQPQVEIFAEQLASIQDQTWTAWVCVLSFDSPLEALRADPRLAPFFIDKRFLWIENAERLGHKKNFERAIQKALEQGVDAIACSDQDDVWYPKKLARSVEELEKRGALSLVHCDMHVLRDVGRGIWRHDAKTAWKMERRGVHNTRPHDLMVRNVVAGCAMLLDAELARSFPLIPEGVEFHDYWYALVASCHKGVWPIREPLYAYRQHGVNEVGVSPYQGVLSLPNGVGWVGIRKKFLEAWGKSQAMAKAVSDAKMPLSTLQRVMFFQTWDLGLGFCILGLYHLLDDPALARAYFKRAIGKMIARLT